MYELRELMHEALVDFHLVLEDPPGKAHPSEQTRLERALHRESSYVLGGRPAGAIQESICIENPILRHQT